MIPILWRYLLKSYLKVFFLTTSSFILILFVTRLKEIAKIVAITPQFKYVFLFIVNIIPFILPIAIPIACLLSSILLYNRLSTSHELTALRSCGLSLFTLSYPVLATAFLLSLSNFFIVSELTTHSQLYSKKLINELLTQNPFYLLENRGKLKLRDFFVDMILEERGKTASNVFFISPDKSDQHLNLISVKKLKVEEGEIFAPSVNIITSIPNKKSKGYDHLIVENERNIRAKAKELSKLIKNSHFHLYSNHCSLPFLMISIHQLKEKILAAKHLNEREKVRHYKGDLTQNYSEIIMRISIGISAWTFTLLGLSFAIDIGRERRMKNFILIALLTFLSLICLFTGKIFMKNLFLSLLIYFMPHLLIVGLSLYRLRCISKGIEI